MSRLRSSRLIGNLTLGGKIRRDMAAYRWYLPIASYHDQSSAEWLWSLEAYQYRQESGCSHRLFGRCYIQGAQSRTIWDIAGLFSVQLMRQRSAYATREIDRIKERLP